MTGSIGTSTIYTTILPNSARLGRINPKDLSNEAKFRLRVIDFYYGKSGKNGSLTCRHFAVSRSFLYKWLGRYNPRDLSTLESHSKRPHRVRQATYDTSLVSLIRKLRTDFPTYSSKRLHVILKRDWHILISAATIGRIIKRFSLYFARKVVSRARFQAARRARRLAITRKPSYLKATSPHQLIEFDMKHIRVGNAKQYAFCAIDPYTKQSLIHVASTPSSQNAKVAIEKILTVFGRHITILNDNGSENFGKVYSYLQDQNITQYFARPHTPKDKPYIENLIGKLQQECLDEDDRTTKTIAERQAQINRWLNDYHFFRPHQSLNYQTPQEFCDTLGLTIPRLEVCAMW